MQKNSLVIFFKIDFDSEKEQYLHLIKGITFCWCQGKPGVVGLADLPGLPGEDGAPGQKVGSSMFVVYLPPSQAFLLLSLC